MRAMSVAGDHVERNLNIEDVLRQFLEGEQIHGLLVEFVHRLLAVFGRWFEYGCCYAADFGSLFGTQGEQRQDRRRWMSSSSGDGPGVARPACRKGCQNPQHSSNRIRTSVRKRPKGDGRTPRADRESALLPGTAEERLRYSSCVQHGRPLRTSLSSRARSRVAANPPTLQSNRARGGRTGAASAARLRFPRRWFLDLPGDGVAGRDPESFAGSLGRSRGCQLR